MAWTTERETKRLVGHNRNLFISSSYSIPGWVASLLLSLPLYLDLCVDFIQSLIRAIRPPAWAEQAGEVSGQNETSFFPSDPL